jgi:hypothetical protein
MDHKTPAHHKSIDRDQKAISQATIDKLITKALFTSMDVHDPEREIRCRRSANCVVFWTFDCGQHEALFLLS